MAIKNPDLKNLASILLTKGLPGKFLIHYLWGKGADMSLVPKDFKDTDMEKALKEAFSVHVKGGMDYKSCVTRCGGTEDLEWWEGLAGVVGEFHWNPIFEEQGVRFQCWDRFDFNPMQSLLCIPVP